MFKKTRIISYVGMIPLLAAWGLIVWKTLQREFGFLESFLFVLLALFLYAVLVGGTGVYADNKVHRKLFGYHDNCRPDKMLEGYLEGCAQLTQPLHLRTYYINISVAYTELGEWQAAKDALQKVPLPPKVNDTAMAVKNNLCLCHLALGETGEAKACIDWLAEQVKGMRGKNSFIILADKYENHTLHLIYLYNITLGNDEGAESYFINDLELDATTVAKVQKQYQLGGIYLRRGALEQAREAYTYVAQNGGTTWYVPAAQQALAQMDESMPVSV